VNSQGADIAGSSGSRTSGHATLAEANAATGRGSGPNGPAPSKHFGIVSIAGWAFPLRGRYERANGSIEGRAEQQRNLESLDAVGQPSVVPHDEDEGERCLVQVAEMDVFPSTPGIGLDQPSPPVQGEQQGPIGATVPSGVGVHAPPAPPPTLPGGPNYSQSGHTLYQYGGQMVGKS